MTTVHSTEMFKTVYVTTKIYRITNRTHGFFYFFILSTASTFRVPLKVLDLYFVTVGPRDRIGVVRCRR